MSDDLDDIEDPGLRGVPRALERRQPTRSKLETLVRHLYRNASFETRGQMLRCLLRPLGPLAMLTVASGAFAKYLPREDQEGMRFGAEDLARHSGEQISDLVQFVVQVSPDVLQELSNQLMVSPGGLTAFGVSVVLVLAQTSRRGLGRLW